MRDVVKTQSKARIKVNNRQQIPQSRPKKKRRKKNRSLYFLMILILMIFAFVVLSLTVFFKIEKITIMGSAPYSQEQIIAASGVKNGDNIIRIDTKKVEQNVLDALVNVESVKVSREFPAELRIEVTQCVPAANIECGGKYFVISKQRKIIEENLSAPKENLPVIYGYDTASPEINKPANSNDSEKGQIVDEILNIIENLQFEKIDKIDITDRLAIMLIYDNRISIKLGSRTDLEYKTNFAKTIITGENFSPTFQGDIIMREGGEASVIEKSSVTSTKATQ